jgi:isochorismate pyruvate lyase
VAKAKKARAKSKRPAPKAKSRKKRGAKEADWRVDCKSLADIRAHIDHLDNIIAPLICKRNYFVTQAAKFKPSVAGVVVPSRVEEIITRVRRIAEDMKSDSVTIESIYRAIIDAMTAAEQRHWQDMHRK